MAYRVEELGFPHVEVGTFTFLHNARIVADEYTSKHKGVKVRIVKLIPIKR